MFVGVKRIATVVHPHQVQTLMYTAEKLEPRFIGFRDEQCVVQFRHTAQQMVSTTEQFRALTPARRKCLYPHERKLDYYPHYHRSNCMLECAWKQAFKACVCSPWFPASVKMRQTVFHQRIGLTSSQLCNVMELSCFDEAVNSVLSGDGDRLCSHDCPSDCEMVTYSVMIDIKGEHEESAGLCQDAIARLNCDFRDKDCKEGIGKNITLSSSKRFLVKHGAIVKKLTTLKSVCCRTIDDAHFMQVFCTNTALQLVTRTASSSIMELVSQIGGTLGLFLGCSVLSVVEITTSLAKSILGRSF